MTPWIHLLASTLRLVDLHDSNHERHADNTSVSVETRPGLGDGYWLDIACLLLEYLLETGLPHKRSIYSSRALPGTLASAHS